MANKCDKPDKVIESERGKQLADEYGLSFFETSAKTGFNVNDVFSHIAQVIIREKMPAGGFTNGGGAAASKQTKLKAADGKKEDTQGSTCCS